MIGINHILVDQKHHLHGGKTTATEAQVDQDMKKEQDRKAGAERKKTQKVFEDQWSFASGFFVRHVYWNHTSYYVQLCFFKTVLFIVCVSIDEKRKQDIKYMEIQRPPFLRPPPHIITKHG